MQIAEKFEQIWQFPHCLGALDGKHIVIQSPINTGSDFFNYKGSFSIVLMALVDADYNFLYVDVGSRGRISDGGVWGSCSLRKSIDDGVLDIPQDEILPGRENPAPFYFVADDAFPLTRKIMKPYPGFHAKGSQKRGFNYRLSRARRVVENAFGILASVFRVLRKPMLLQPGTAKEVVMTTVCLHKFRRLQTAASQFTLITGEREERSNGQPNEPGFLQVDTGTVTSFLLLARKPSRDAECVRQEIAEFLLGNRVPWQDECE